uniref:Uncharacterized protein n=1 Tax=Anguilla anguilla TaxID=7936 RepID=A0A0E9X237_ANGAN
MTLENKQTAHHHHHSQPPFSRQDSNSKIINRIWQISQWPLGVLGSEGYGGSPYLRLNKFSFTFDQIVLFLLLFFNTVKSSALHQSKFKTGSVSYFMIIKFSQRKKIS